MICLELNFTFRVECCKFLNLSGPYVLRQDLFLTIFSLKTQQIRTKISSDQKRLFFALSLYPLPIFANTLFNGEQSLYLCSKNIYLINFVQEIIMVIENIQRVSLPKENIRLNYQMVEFKQFHMKLMSWGLDQEYHMNLLIQILLKPYTMKLLMSPHIIINPSVKQLCYNLEKLYVLSIILNTLNTQSTLRILNMQDTQSI